MRKAVLCALLLLVALLITLFSSGYAAKWNSHDTKGAPSGLVTVHLDGRPLKVTIVDTPEEKEKGLGGRAGLAQGEGMLFAFPKDDEYGFWMKDMRFAIDIIWLSAGGVVVHIEKNVSPNTYPHVFKPKEAARYVLELPAGYTDVYTVHPGSAVQF